VKKLDELATQQVENQTALNLLQTRMKSHEINAATLKDDGAKAEMVDQYLPYINSQINHYLDRMNLFINIELDTEFEIKMNAPDRRGQSISSLSTGQQGRIDLAVLLAWRDVARAAAGCDTNILILDEILENMSEQGVEDFIEMWGMEEQSDVALYVVTQRISEFSQHFDNTIMYKLTDARTELVTSV
jgi:DNA repair exonuclease SbcCD ATPase subunit